MKKKSDLQRILFICLGLLLLFTAFGCQSQQKPVTGSGAEQVVKIGNIKALGTITPYVAIAQGIYQQQGLQVEIVDFNDGSTLMEAFAVGQLDAAYVGIAPAAIWAAKGIPLKVVASANGGGHVVMTREDANVKKVADLKGKKVSTPKAGTVTDTLLRAKVLKDAGLNPESDLTIIPGVAPADVSTGLIISKEVDAAITWEPFATQMVSQYPNARVLYDASAEWRKEKNTQDCYPVNFVIANQKFIDQRPEVLKKFLQAHKDTTDFINNDAQKANALIAKELNLAPDLIAKARKQIDYTYKLDITSTMATLQWSNQLGYLPALPDPNQLFTSAFLPK